MVKDFVKWVHFVGYESGTRIWDLMRTGYVESKKIEWSRFCSYSLTEKWLEYIPETKTYTVAEDVSYKFEKETTFQSIKRFFSI